MLDIDDRLIMMFSRFNQPCDILFAFWIVAVAPAWIVKGLLDIDDE